MLNYSKLFKLEDGQELKKEDIIKYINFNKKIREHNVFKKICIKQKKKL